MKSTSKLFICLILIPLRQASGMETEKINTVNTANKIVIDLFLDKSNNTLGYSLQQGNTEIKPLQIPKPSWFNLCTYNNLCKKRIANNINELNLDKDKNYNIVIKLYEIIPTQQYINASLLSTTENSRKKNAIQWINNEVNSFIDEKIGYSWQKRLLNGFFLAPHCLPLLD
ncbi:MAG: hypothetical protein WDZ41_04595 [Candidatus Babeliales bacterium]